MKIAVFTDTFYPEVNGIVISILNSTNILAKKGYKIKIFAPKYKNKKELALNKNISVERFHSVPLLTYKDVRVTLPRILKIRRIIKKFKPDIIHIHTPGPVGVLGLLFAGRYNIPSIGTYHTLVSQQLMYLSLFKLIKLDRLLDKYKTFLYERRKKPYNIEKLLRTKKRHIKKILNEGLSKKFIWNITRRIYNRCDIVSVPSPSIKKELINHKFKKSIVVISNGIDLKKFFPKKNYKSNKIKLLHVGRIGYEKNIDIMIKAFKIIHQKFPNTTLSIIGDGPALNDLKKLAKKLGLYGIIKFTGHVPHTKLNKIYNNHDIFVTTSTMETQGLVILEAMACGLPIIGVNKYAIPDLVSHGKNGFIAPPFNIKQIIKHLTKLIKSQKLREKFGKKSFEIAKQHDLNVVVCVLKNIYNKLINLH